MSQSILSIRVLFPIPHDTGSGLCNAVAVIVSKKLKKQHIARSEALHKRRECIKECLITWIGGDFVQEVTAGNITPAMTNAFAQEVTKLRGHAPCSPKAGKSIRPRTNRFLRLPVEYVKYFGAVQTCRTGTAGDSSGGSW